MGLFERLFKQRTGTEAGTPPFANAPQQNAQTLLEKGLRLEQQGHSEEALHCYDQAIDLMPSLARAHFNRGTILLDRGDALLALAAFNAALSYKPDSVGTHFNIGNAHLQLGNLSECISAYQNALGLNPGFTDARLALEKALALTPDYVAYCFQQGLACQDRSQLEEAEIFYRKVLDVKPDHADACNNLGGILLRREVTDEAEVYFRRAAEAAPGNASVLMNLGNVQKILGHMEDAMASFQRAAHLRPDDEAAFVQIANVQLDLRLHADAVANYRHALELSPDNAEANLNQGIALVELEQIEAAEKCYRRALELEPRNAAIHSNLGVLLKRRGEMEVALGCFRQALELQPNFTEAYVNMGTVLQAIGQIDAAMASYQSALEINPNSAVALSNYASVLQHLGKMDEAESYYLQALEIDPDMSIAHNNLGTVYNETQRHEASVMSYRCAIRLKPNYADAYANLGIVLKDLGRLGESLRALERALEIDPGCIAAHNNLLFIHNYVADQPAGRLLADAQRFGEMAARSAKPYTEWANLPDPHRALRVGFVSGDLGDHPVGYFLEGVLKALMTKASAKLELFAYPTRTREDETSKRLRTCFKSWHSAVGLSDAALAKRIRDDGIDILIDLSGHTAHNRLPVFAWKPAPVQVSWLGYFATTGVAAMDYFLADPWTLPPKQEAYFTEQIWRLPETRLCFTPPDARVDVNALPALSNGYITFGSFNNLSKMNDAVVQLWARVLHAVPASRLLLKYQQLANASVRHSTLQRFAAHGIGSERMIFEDFVARANYLAAYHQVDICLDPFPFPGGTTTAEALWMGVPVLTLSGERFLSRQGVGLLMNAGLADWIASDPDDYVARAATHAGDLQRLADLRSGLRRQVLASPIFDAPRFAENFEIALRGMWHKWCAVSAQAQH